MRVGVDALTANWLLCLFLPKDRIEGVKAKRPVCPTFSEEMII
jgi:hypothetical protein